MLLKDYGTIIIKGLCNSPHHLKEYFEREVLKLSEKHYGRKEVEDMLRQVLEMHKARIIEIYEKDISRYKLYSEQDKALPLHEKYFYPCPELNEISLTHLDFPFTGRIAFPDGRKYTLVDFANVEAALNEVFGTRQAEAKAKQETPILFEELFYDINFVSPCIDILKKVEPSLIDSECNYIGKLKGAFCVWVDEMQRQGIMKHFSDRKIFASLIPLKIKRFSIDESMFGKNQKRAESKYRTDMKTLLSQVKLSLNSQKGKLGK